MRVIRPYWRFHFQGMIYHVLFYFVTLILDVFASVRVAPTETDLQIALLRQQLRILERNSKTTNRLSRPEKLMLLALATHLKAQTQRFHDALGNVIVARPIATPMSQRAQINAENVKKWFSVSFGAAEGIIRQRREPSDAGHQNWHDHTSSA